MGIEFISHPHRSGLHDKHQEHSKCNELTARGLTWTLPVEITALEMEMVEVPAVEGAWGNARICIYIDQTSTTLILQLGQAGPPTHTTCKSVVHVSDQLPEVWARDYSWMGVVRGRGLF